MTERKTTHGTFVVDRTYPAAPARVFAAFADAEAKARWFGGPLPWKLIERTFDFRVGGREVLHGVFEGGAETLFTAHYHHITPNERIVYAYDMVVAGRQISVSVATIEVIPVAKGARLVLTEQGAFFDDLDSVATRERGTLTLMDRLGASLA